MTGAARLAILGCGMSTPVGLSAPATVAAIRARIDGFQETKFFARDGSFIKAGEVPLEDSSRGVSRLASLVTGPIRECLALVPQLAPEAIPILLCLAERDRPGRFTELDTELPKLLEQALGLTLHPASEVISLGRVSCAAGLRKAQKLMMEHGLTRVIIAGTDTYVVAATLADFDERRRLLTRVNSNGFIPGEAGAALLVGLAGAQQGLTVLSLGFAVEKATIADDQPLRGHGLTTAFREALSDANITMAQIGYRIGTMTGEQYWFKEIELASSRLLRGRHEFMDLWHPADCIGETGAALLPVCIGLALIAAQKNFAAGDPVLVSASNDDGRRAALVLAAG